MAVFNPSRHIFLPKKSETAQYKKKKQTTAWFCLHPALSLSTVFSARRPHSCAQAHGGSLGQPSSGQGGTRDPALPSSRASGRQVLLPRNLEGGTGGRGAPGWPLGENVDKAWSQTHAGHSQGDPGNPGNPRLRTWGRKEVQVSRHAGGFRGASDTLGGPGRGWKGLLCPRPPGTLRLAHSPGVRPPVPNPKAPWASHTGNGPQSEG